MALILPWRTLRLGRGLSQRELARQAGVDQGYYSRVEHGDARMSQEFAAKLWAVIGWPPYPWLAEWAGDPAQAPIQEMWCQAVVDRARNLPPPTQALIRDTPWQVGLCRVLGWSEAIPATDLPGLVWWSAIFTDAVQGYIPDALRDPAVAQVDAFQAGLYSWPMALSQRLALSSVKKDRATVSAGGLATMQEIWPRLKLRQQELLLELAHEWAAPDGGGDS